MKGKTVLRWIGLSIACSTLLTVTSCGDCDDGGGGGGATVVNVTLREFSVTPARDSAPRGRITFAVTNGGTEEHEFLVIRTDLPADELPTEEDGTYEENGPGTELIEEIEPFEPGDTERITLTLEAGHYVLICNLFEIEDDEVEAHYSLGMFTDFDVT